MSKKSLHKYGWKPSLPDKRDFLYAAPFHKIGQLPAEVDLQKTGFTQPIRDQGSLGSCTANAVGSLHYFLQKKQGQKAFNPSRLGIYYLEREMEGTIGYDSGAFGRDGFRALVKYGAWPEELQKYVVKNFRNKPSAAAYKAGLDHQALVFFRVIKQLEQLQGCLAEGYPFAFGFTVYESFEDDSKWKNGIMPLPRRGESVLGGHEIYADKYKIINGVLYFGCVNSWTATWQLSGRFWMPASFMIGSDTSDHQTLRSIE